MSIFLRRSTVGLEPLPLVMSGVRAGERLLQLGLEDAALAEAMAKKVGLNGLAGFAVTTSGEADAARALAVNAGVLADVHLVQLARALVWPADIEAGSFDVVVVHGRNGLIATLDPGICTGVLTRCLHALRPGGRLVAIDAAASTGISAWLRRGPAPNISYEAAGGTAAALEQAGFRPVRVLAERDGFKFTEGLRPTVP